MQKLSEISRRADLDKELWRSGRYWALFSAVKARVEGPGTASEEVAMSIDTIAELLQTNASSLTAETVDQAHLIQLEMLGLLALSIDIPRLIARSAIIEQALSSKAASLEPVLCFVLRWISAVPLVPEGAFHEFAEKLVDAARPLFSAASTSPDPDTKYKCLMIGFSFTHQVDQCLLQEGVDWDVLFGPAGSTVIEASRTFDYDRIHDFMVMYTNLDTLNFAAGSWYALMVHYGDILSTMENAERSLCCVRRAIEDSRASDVATLCMGLPITALAAYTCELPRKQQEPIAVLLRDFGLTWYDADDTVDTVFVHHTCRLRGDSTKNAHLFSGELPSYDASIDHQ